MNQMQLENGLFELAEKTGFKYFPEQIKGVINAIIKFYCNNGEFYEEDAIRVFKHFLKTGALDFNI